MEVCRCGLEAHAVCTKCKALLCWDHVATPRQPRDGPPGPRVDLGPLTTVESWTIGRLLGSTGVLCEDCLHELGQRCLDAARRNAEDDPGLQQPQGDDLQRLRTLRRCRETWIHHGRLKDWNEAVEEAIENLGGIDGVFRLVQAKASICEIVKVRGVNARSVKLKKMSIQGASIGTMRVTSPGDSQGSTSSTWLYELLLDDRGDIWGVTRGNRPWIAGPLDRDRTLAINLACSFLGEEGFEIDSKSVTPSSETAPPRVDDGAIEEALSWLRSG